MGASLLFIILSVISIVEARQEVASRIIPGFAVCMLLNVIFNVVNWSTGLLQDTPTKVLAAITMLHSAYFAAIYFLYWLEVQAKSRLLEHTQMSEAVSS